MQISKEENLTQEELKRQLDYDHFTGLFVWKVSNTNTIQIGDIAGTMCHDYINIGINGIVYGAHRLAWLYVYGYLPENDIDHKDRIKHHNWILNLREISRSCNIKNTGNWKTNTSGIKGVYLHKQSNKWIAQIKINYKKKYLGIYKDFDDAVCARLAAEQCFGWSDCDSCSPAYKYVKEHFGQNH